MAKLNHYTTISEFHKKSGYPPPEHPLLSVITCKEFITCSLGESRFTGDFYVIAFKKIVSGHFFYGKTKYDHDNGSMMFIKPRQIVEISNIELEEKGFLILIHEDYLAGHLLQSQIKNYGYFEYEINEALHLSPSEENTIWDLYEKIKAEYNNSQDEFSREIILAHIDTILKYSDRFYKRQFVNRSNNLSGTTIHKFHNILSQYMEKSKVQEQGLPTVHQLAGQLFLSPRYLSDVLKQETGKTALEHIHIYLIGEAKNRLLSADDNVAEIAYQLGFENPPYFTRLFKKVTGLTPVQYKEQHLN